MEKSDILKAASNAYYMNPSVIKFLLVENLALKTLLHEKGLITPEEYKKFQEHAGAILGVKEEEQMMKYFKSILEKSPTQEPSQDNLEGEVRKI
jgi:uncharacterized HAD superfamily protein